MSLRGQMGRLFAQLIRFYGISPEALMRTPEWQVAILVEHMPALIAEEQLRSADAAIMPHASERDRRKAIRNWTRAAKRGLTPPQKRAPIEVIEHNPDKAAAYFEAMGLRVKRKGEAKPLPDERGN